MSWEDRLKEPAITTPDGKRYVFEYEDVSKITTKKTNKFTFSDTTGTLVQDFGVGEVGFPLTIFFSGTDYDQTADAFDISAGVAGISLLEHPIYGIHDVVIESIERADNLKSGANQAIFNLTMTETIVPASPVSAASLRTNIENNLDTVQELNAEQFTVNVDKVKDKAALKNRVLNFIDTYNKTFAQIQKLSDDVNDTINSTTDYINSNIDDLLSAPVTLANSIQNIIRAPARVTNSIKTRIQAYTEAISNILDDLSTTDGTDEYNQALEIQLYATSLIASAAESCLNVEEGENGFITRSDATTTALQLIKTLQDIQNYIDTLQENAETEDDINIRFTQSSELLLELKNTISQTTSQLIKLSFSLKQEKTMYNEVANETIITLCHKLYGGIESDPLEFTGTQSRLDFFIQSNELTGEELITIPYGRKILYYA